MGIFIGNDEVIESNFDAVYQGSTQLWPVLGVPTARGCEIEVKLVPGETSFEFAGRSAFLVEQDGTVVEYTGTKHTITGMHDRTFIKISLIEEAAHFKFYDDNILEAKWNKAGTRDSWFAAFSGLTRMTKFECAADLGGIRYFGEVWDGCSGLTSFPLINTSGASQLHHTWIGCSGLTSFPLLDIGSTNSLNGCWRRCSGLTTFPNINMSKVDDFRNTWFGCSSITCFAGTVDFSGLRSGTNAFEGCTALTAPAPTGTPVRATDNATRGTWTNSTIC